MDLKLDTGVQAVLNALEMGKYSPVFLKYGVSMEVFTTLTEEDLRTMGVEENDLEPILKYAKKLGRTESKRIDLDLRWVIGITKFSPIDFHSLNHERW